MSVAMFGKKKRHEIQETDWVTENVSVTKRWAVRGLLYDNRKLEIEIDVSLSQSNITGDVEPLTLFTFMPNFLGDSKKTADLKIGEKARFEDARAYAVKLEMAEDAIVAFPFSPDLGITTVNVLGEATRVMMALQSHSELLLQIDLPTNPKQFLSAMKSAALNFRSISESSDGPAKHQNPVNVQNDTVELMHTTLVEAAHSLLAISDALEKTGAQNVGDKTRAIGERARTVALFYEAEKSGKRKR